MALGNLRGEASTVMIEEVVHVGHRRRGDRIGGIADGRAAASVLAVLHPVGQKDLDSALELFGEHDSLHMRDAIHLAIARCHGMTTILSTDRGFEGIEGIRRVDPADLSAVSKLAGS